MGVQRKPSRRRLRTANRDPMDGASLTEFARSLTDTELAASLEFNATYNRSETAKAVMHEAASAVAGRTGNGAGS